MCGGLARWLRALGYDTAYTEGIDDRELIEQARREGRIVISADGKLFERRAITTRQVRALRLPRGLKRMDQLAYVVKALHLVPLEPRCTRCNGRLDPARRDEVADVVPARSLIWANRFFRCASCGHVVPARSLIWANRFFRCASCGQAFWDGTHWRRIEAVRRRFAGRSERA